MAVSKIFKCKLNRFKEHITEALQIWVWTTIMLLSFTCITASYFKSLDCIANHIEVIALLTIVISFLFSLWDVNRLE